MPARLVRPLAITLLGAALASCGGDATAPTVRLAHLSNIAAPAGAFPGDTLRVSFDWTPQGACDPLDHIDVRQTSDSASFAVWTRAVGGTCPYVAVIHSFAALVPPPHDVPFTLVFREPGGRDSTRTVAPAP